MRLTLATGILLVAITIPIIGKDSVHTHPHADYSDRSDESPQQAAAVVQANTDTAQPKQAPPAEPIDSGRDQDDVNARKMLYLTVCLAVSTFTLAVFGIVQAIATWRTANAAKASADALVNIERALMHPVVLIEPRDLMEMARSNCPNPVEISIRFNNTGRTPAWVTGWCFNTLITPTERVIPFEYTGVSNALDAGEPIAAGNEENLFHDFSVARFCDIDEIREGRAYLYAYGFLMYRDIFNQPHETYFSRRYTRRLLTEPGVYEEGWLVDGPDGANRYN